MSHQFSALLSAEDYLALGRQLQGRNVVFLARGADQDGGLVAVPEFSFPDKELILYLCERNALDKIVLRKLAKNWEIDGLRSPVIECMRSAVSAATIRRGRFHYDTAFFDTAKNEIRKAVEFLGWADNIFRFLKRSLRRRADLPLQPYVGSGVRAQLVSGSLRYAD